MGVSVMEGGERRRHKKEARKKKKKEGGEEEKREQVGRCEVTNERRKGGRTRAEKT